MDWITGINQQQVEDAEGSLPMQQAARSSENPWASGKS